MCLLTTKDQWLHFFIANIITYDAATDKLDKVFGNKHVIILLVN